MRCLFFRLRWSTVGSIGHPSWLPAFLPFLHLHLTTNTDKALPCHLPLLNSCRRCFSDLLITHFKSPVLRLVISSLKPCNISGLQIKTHSLDTLITQLKCSAAGIFQVNSSLQLKPCIEAKGSSNKFIAWVFLQMVQQPSWPPISHFLPLATDQNIHLSYRELKKCRSFEQTCNFLFKHSAEKAFRIFPTFSLEKFPALILNNTEYTR